MAKRKQPKPSAILQQLGELQTAQRKIARATRRQAAQHEPTFAEYMAETMWPEEDGK